MARTKQTSRASTSARYERASFGSERKPKKKKPRQRKRWMSMSEKMRGGCSGWEYDPLFHMMNNLNRWQAPGLSTSTSDIIDLDEMGHDDLDDEVMLGSIRGNIVGIRYYHGTVNNNEMVALEREPFNKYDKNAIKVTNVDRTQVGHIKRELAKPLAEIIDKQLARPEGVVPFGAKNAYSMPIDISLWGKVENQLNVMSMLRMYGFNGYTPSYDQQPSTSAGMGYTPVRRTFLSPSEIKNELDRLFENLTEGDKTSTTEPAKAVGTSMYTHQKQALHWMIQREKGTHLPPFWEERNGKYFNSVTVFTSNQRPRSVKGGILADDMGLGKTLEMIALIITHFKDDKPLALPVQGAVRKSKELRAIKKEQMVEEGMKEVKPSFKKLKLKFGEGKPGCSQMSYGPVGKKLSRKKILGLCPDPNLPDDEDESSDTDDEELEFEQVTELGDASSCMVKKEDPEYVPPELKETNENFSPARSRRRPRRDVKRPARYAESDLSEDDLEGSETPNKTRKRKVSDDKPYHQPTGKGKGIGKGRGKKSTRKVVPEDTDHHKKETSDAEEVKPMVKTEFTVDPVLGATSSEVAVKTEAQETKPSVKAEPTVVKKLVKPELTEEIGISVQSMDCDDLPDPSLNHFILETDPLDDLEEIGSRLGPSDFGEGTGRTETTGARSTLIICPLSVLNNWLDQLEDHVHELVHLSVYTYYGQSRTKDPKVLSQQDIVLTTYSTVTADAKGKANPLQKIDWLRIVLDEGHAIRNPNTQQSKAICSLKAERKWILTGTPIQNSMKDLWSLVNFLQISPFTDKQWWNRAIERPLNEGNESALKRVQHLMGVISLRRTKTMKINNKPIVELPERKVFVEHVKLSDEERLVYEAMQKEGKLIVSRYFTQGTLLHNYGDVLAILMRLRQMCCHPLLVAKAAAAVQETVGHLEPGQAISDHLREKLVSKLLEVLQSGSDEECAVCIDGLKEPVITHCAHVFCKRCIESVIQSDKPVPRCPLCRGNIDANKLLQPSPEELNQQKDDDQTDISADTWKSSAKVDALINSLVKVRQEDSTVKSLVVSQFTSLLSLIEIPLRLNGFQFVRLDGSMSLKQRHAAIAQLSNTCIGSPTIMLLSLTAGGVGINLTAASRVYLMDPAWNPATEDQCFDRCHRLGQTRDVIVTKFIVDDSVEGRMMDLQDKKRTLMQGAFGKKQSAEEKRASRIKDLKTLMDL